MVGLKSGRTIGEKREKLETASERAATHKKNKRQKITRIVLTTVGFVVMIVIIVMVVLSLINNEQGGGDSDTIVVPYTPTIEIIDEAASATGGRLTSRMKEYIGQVEVDLRELGYAPVKAVIPSSGIREVDFYLDGYTGYIKMITDRGAGVSAEDTDRMIRYLTSIGVSDFQYIDVRIERRAYWR